MPGQASRGLRAGVIGDPVAHSLSPAIHGYWLKAYGIEGSYEAYPVRASEFNEKIRQFREEGFRGLNVTLPHKEAAFAIADWKDDLAIKTGAVNTLVFTNDQIKGYNTDVFGFSENLKSKLNPVESYIDSCLVLGAGGAARGIIHSLISLGARQIFLTNRTQEKAQILANQFQELTRGASPVSCIAWENRHEPLRDISLLVNTTQLGMIGQPPLDLDLVSMPNNAAIADIVYKPLKTPLLEAGAKRGLVTVDGLGMLLWQAAPGFEMWFGKRPGVTQTLRTMIESLL